MGLGSGGRGLDVETVSKSTFARFIKRGLIGSLEIVWVLRIVKSKRVMRVVFACFIGILATCGQNKMMGQTNQTEATKWLAKAELSAAFVPPASKRRWETERKRVREE